MNVNAIAGSVIKLASSHQQKAASSVSERDPSNAGTVTAPSHPDGDNNAKTGLPEQSRPKNNDNCATVVVGENVAKPSGTGENVPTVAKTVELGAEKAATAAKAVGASLRALAAKSASAPAVAAPAAVLGAPKAAAAPAAVATAPKAAASVDAPETLRGDVFSKIASELAATEEGRAVLNAHLERRVGQQMAANLLKSAAEAHQAERAEHEKQAAEAQAAELFSNVLVGSLVKRASSTRTQEWLKNAFEIHQANLGMYPEFAHPLLKAAYAQGVDDAGATAPEGQAGALPGAEGTQVDPEEILALIQQMVQSGEISEEDAQGILQELGAALQGGAEGAPVEGAPAEGAEPTAEELAQMAPAEKAARLAYSANVKYASARATELAGLAIKK